MFECFWWSKPRTLNELIKAHIIVDVTTEETEAGTEGEVYKAACGEVMFSHYYSGNSKPQFGTRQEAKKSGIPICPECLKRVKKR